MMIGASPPSPKCEISVTAAAKIDATPPSIALPPAAITRAPASTVNVRPAATTPCAARTSPRTGVRGWPDVDELTISVTADTQARMRRLLTGGIVLRFPQPAHGECSEQRTGSKE